MSRSFHLKLLCAVVAVSSAACASFDSPIPLPEGQWEMTASSLVDMGHMPGIAPATLQIRYGRLSAFSGCNTGAGAVSAVDGKMVVAAMASTRRACLNPAGDFENRYFKLLQARPDFRTEGDTLVVSAGEDKVSFRRVIEKPVPAKPQS